jgi:hypothetical protein
MANVSWWKGLLSNLCPRKVQVAAAALAGWRNNAQFFYPSGDKKRRRMKL